MVSFIEMTSCAQVLIGVIGQYFPPGFSTQLGFCGVTFSLDCFFIHGKTYLCSEKNFACNS